MNRPPYALAGFLIVLSAWAIAFWLHAADAFFFPDPVAVLAETVKMLTDGEITGDLILTVSRVATAFAASVIIGVPLGLALGASTKAFDTFESVIDFFRSIPATAIFPLFLLVFGIGDQSKIAVAIMASSLVIIFNTASGIRNSSKVRRLAARLMGATHAQTFKNILFWETLPQTFTGIRTALSLTLIVIVVTEMFVGTSAGLGRRIVDMQITYDVTGMYAAILITGILGYALNWMVAIVERRVVHWTS